MKLKDVKVGQKFMFVNGGVLTDIYVKKRNWIDGWCIVGLPKVYDEFAASIEEEVIAE